MRTNHVRPGLIRSRRASVAIYIAFLAPVLAGATALGVEVSSWSGAKVDLQRTADSSAMQAMLYCYRLASSASNCSNSTTVAQTAATLAARLAEANGGSGGSSPTWDSGTETYTDNQIIAQVTHGVRQLSDAAIRVTVQKTVPLTISKAFSSQTAVTVSATSTGELVATAGGGGGGQPCALALSGDSVTNPITAGTDLGISGNININAPTCTLVSDQGVYFNGGVSVTAAAIYAAGSINVGAGSATINATEYQHAGQIGDPYVNNVAVQNALTTANTATGSPIVCTTSKGSCTGPTNWGSCSGTTCTINPGTYTGLAISGGATYVLNPGLYTINGNISFQGGTTITGTNVTILMGAGTAGGNTITTSGNTVVALYAATTTNATGGAIPGIVFGSQSTGSSNLAGSAGLAFTGLIYYPDGAISITGSSASGSTTCAEMIGYTISLAGSANFGSSCGDYGLMSFGSQASSTTYLAKLVQ